MKIKQYTVYKFNELSEDVQDKAIENLYDLNVDYEWWQFVYDDAKEIGLEISEFDLDRSSYVKGELNVSVGECCRKLLVTHGKTCDTYKLAQNYFRSKKESKPFGIENFTRALCEEYRIILQKECDYLTSRESIIETIEANDYDFTENGKID